MNQVKTIFVGTSEFSIGILNILKNLDFIQLTAVITQPDRPVGRKQLLTPPPLKQHIIDNKFEVDVLQPEILRKEAKEIIEKYNPELIIVASYGQMVPRVMLESPKYKCLNMHVSLLPHLRGAVPMPMAILEGLSQTGVALQIMTKGLDEGDIISEEMFDLDGTETTESLENKSIQASERLLHRDLYRWIMGEIVPVPQDHSKATYCTKEDLAKEKAEITFNTAVQIAERMVRAFYPWPIAWIVIPNGIHTGKRMKIFSSKIQEMTDLKQENINDHEEVILFKQNGSLYLQLKDGILELIEVQIEGKSKISGKLMQL
jgi:methionyl-tRNA formyltransferase